MAKTRSAPVDLRQYLGRSVDDTVRALRRKGIRVLIRLQELPGPLAIVRHLIPPPTVRRGDSVIALTTGNRVMGWAVPDAGPKLAELVAPYVQRVRELAAPRREAAAKRDEGAPS